VACGLQGAGGLGSTMGAVLVGAPATTKNALQLPVSEK
jgi:hypothetical protein